MSWRVLRPQIVTLLETIDEIAEVSPTPKVQFNAYPAVHVVPSENSGDYETTSENERTYAWTIRVFYETKNTGIEDAYVALEEVVDEIIDLFDQEDMKGSERTVGVDLPSRYMYLNMFAIPNRWGDVPDMNLLIAEITVRVHVSVDIT